MTQQILSYEVLVPAIGQLRGYYESGRPRAEKSCTTNCEAENLNSQRRSKDLMTQNAWHAELIYIKVENIMTQ